MQSYVAKASGYLTLNNHYSENSLESLKKLTGTDRNAAARLELVTLAFYTVTDAGKSVAKGIYQLGAAGVALARRAETTKHVTQMKVDMARAAKLAAALFYAVLPGLVYNPGRAYQVYERWKLTDDTATPGAHGRLLFAFVASGVALLSRRQLLSFGARAATPLMSTPWVQAAAGVTLLVVGIGLAAMRYRAAPKNPGSAQLPTKQNPSSDFILMLEAHKSLRGDQQIRVKVGVHADRGPGQTGTFAGKLQNNWRLNFDRTSSVDFQVEHLDCWWVKGKEEEVPPSPSDPEPVQEPDSLPSYLTPHLDKPSKDFEKIEVANGSLGASYHILIQTATEPPKTGVYIRRTEFGNAFRYDIQFTSRKGNSYMRTNNERGTLRSWWIAKKTT